MAEGLLNGFRALDLTDEKGFACGKILAALGVETIKVEKPGGDPARGVPPFLHNKPDPEKSLFWLAFNTNKRSITLDLTTGEGRGLFLKLVATSDFILESFTPGYMETLGLGYDALRQINPRIIMTSITPFGQKGPYSRYKGSELIISAMSGIMATNGDPDRPPLREGPDSIYFESCAAATAGTIIAHFHREHTGEGQQVDVSLQEVPAKRMATNIVPWEFDRRLTTRNGTSRSFGVHSTHWIWPCKDGYVFWQFLGGKFSAAGNRALSQWIDDDGQDNPLRKITDWEEFDMAAVTREELVVQQAAIARFFMNHTKKEIAEEGLRRRINATVVSTVADIMENIQLKARNCWVKLNDPDNTGILAYPRHFFVCSETENFVSGRAPRVGEDNRDILQPLSNDEMPMRKEYKAGTRKEPIRPIQQSTEKQALAGVKVLDFGWALVGSLTGKYLADHGAQVVRVESIMRPDFTRANLLTSRSSATNPDDKPWFTHLNTSKYSLSLNLKHPSARGVIERLIQWADVINENFTPGTMRDLGFDYDRVKTMKPDIVMVSSSAYGQTGPMAREWGIDGTGSSLSGYLDLTGWPDRGPVGPSPPYSDTLLPFFNVAAVLAALARKERTGKGQYIDSSMVDICVHQVTPGLLDWQGNGHLQSRNGNRCLFAAPHGVFPCKGKDRWCAIGIFSDDQWNAFCRTLGDPAWAREGTFATLQARKEHEDALEALVAEWTRQYTPVEIMHRMQAAGVPAGVVQTMEDLEQDPQLKEREFLISLEHPVIGIFGHPTPPFKLLSTKAQVKTSPCLGEHNQYICTELLGMSEEEFDELLMQDGLLI